MENANEVYDEIDEIDNDFVDEYDELESDNNDYDDDSEVEKSNDVDSEDDEDEELDSKEDENINFIETAKSSSSILRNRLTKYEFTRLFSIRVTQIQKGAIPMINVEPNMSVEDIVKKEFLQGKVPLLIERTFPKEKIQMKEYCKINELINVSML